MLGVYAREKRSADRHGAYTIAALRDADCDGRLRAWLPPALQPTERAVAQVEGWILGVM